jgi:hypothetical protein
MDACSGQAWANLLTEHIKGEGWGCLAVRAVDNVGNVGVSPAIRICFNRNDGGPEPCADPPPSCMDDCTPPPSFPEGYSQQDF